MASQALVTYGPDEPNSTLLDRSFSQPCPLPELQPSGRRPQPSELRNKLQHISEREDGTFEPPEIIEAVYRSINRTWDAYAEASVSPSSFTRAPVGAPYEIVPIAGKGRGIIASRDIKSGEHILEESPVLVIPHGSANSMIFLLLPKKAVGAILLLHNAHADQRRLSLEWDIPLHRLLDKLNGIMSTNSFEEGSPDGPIGILLLTGSLFNHSETPNTGRWWDANKEKEIFVSLRDVKKGEELVVDYMYVPGVVSASRAKRLSTYGIL